MTSITDIAEAYIASHDASDGHAREIRGHARRYAADFAPDALNADLKRLRTLGRSDSYIRDRRTYVLMLWRYAASCDLAAEPPLSKILRVRRCACVPRGYRAEDVARLLAEASSLTGTYSSGIARADWWTSYIAAAWDTGLSTCDLLAVQRSWISVAGTLDTVRHKTGRRVSVGFYPATLSAIDATFPPERQLIWPLTISREMMRRTFTVIAKSAGLAGSLKWLRSGSGTSVDELHGHGEWHLGNTRAVFERHYLCCRSRVAMPEEVVASRKPR